MKFLPAIFKEILHSDAFHEQSSLGMLVQEKPMMTFCAVCKVWPFINCRI